MPPVHPWVYTTLYIPGYTTVGTMLGDTAAAGDGWDGLTALSRGVTERTVSDIPLTVAPH